MNKQERSQIWAGNPSPIPMLEGQYAAYPDRYLVPYVSALYSFRHVRQAPYRAMLIGLHGEMQNCARDLLRLARTHYISNFPDRADVLSTILLWMYKTLPHAEQNQALARDLCLEAINHLTSPHNGWKGVERYADHTEPLIRLTLASIYLEQEKTEEELREQLAAVELQAHHVTDPRQRARIFRKLGMVLRCNGAWPSGMWYGIRACGLSGIPMAVRIKSVAALLGVER